MWWRVMLGLLICWEALAAQSPPLAGSVPPADQTVAEGRPGAPHSATELYRQLLNPGLDPARLYRIRDAHLDREDLHLSLDDGVIGFTYAIDGRVTGAYFQGEGQILLSPPDRVERGSLGRFSGAAILDEIFTSASLRFNDDVLAELEPDLRPLEPGGFPAAAARGSPAGNVRGADATGFSEDEDLDDEELQADAVDGPAFVRRGNSVLTALAPIAALRLLVTFVNAESWLPDGSLRWRQATDDRYLHVRLASRRRRVFDVFFDTHLPEQIAVGQASTVEGVQYFDEWTSFPMRSVRARVAAGRAGTAPLSTDQTQTAAEQVAVPIKLTLCQAQVHVRPPHSLQADATLDLQVSAGGGRILLLLLSHSLWVSSVEVDGVPIEWVQGEPLHGSPAAGRGNDVVAVVFPAPLAAGQRVSLRLVYGGDVLSEAGGGLLYVGARGTWYPNLGPAMSNFDLEFRYPADWTLLATGKRVAAPVPISGTSELTVRYRSERPIPFAAFNLGRYVKAEARTEEVHIEGYATPQVEDRLARSEERTLPPSLRPDPFHPGRPPAVPLAELPSPPRPAENVQRVTDTIAEDVRFLSQRLGPFPYSELAVTQIPGTSSQSWPGLIYLSSLAFLSSEERGRLHVDAADEVNYSRLMPAHELAHQWWGNLLLWSSYREQWIVEALSNYCAWLLLESHDPAAARQVLERYRHDLGTHHLVAEAIAAAGPVTLGMRLNSSHFPDAYDVIAYERGTWLFHMLRTMLLDGQKLSSPGDVTEAARKRAAGVQHRVSGRSDSEPAADPFFAVLNTLRRRFEGQAVSTRDVQQAFEEVLPPSLRYEGRSSLAWFFDGWVNGTALPVLALEQVGLKRSGEGLLATGKIVQKNAPADLVTSVPLYAEVPGKEPILLERVFAEGAETSFRLRVPPQTRRILLDPFGTVLTK